MEANERALEGGWDFSKLPENMRPEVKRLHNAGDAEGLLKIHDQYGLSIYNYCCYKGGLINWFGYAINFIWVDGK